MPQFAPTPGFIKLSCPEGCTQVYGQVGSQVPFGTEPSVYVPERIAGELIVTLPAGIVTDSLLAAGFAIVDGSPTPPPTPGWTFRDLPFLNWSGNNWRGW